MKKLLQTVIPLCALLAAAPAAEAGDNVVLIELFTSQGCSSCPPADANMAQYAARDDVLALSMHVDYWDYLGWRDTFAKPEHTKRQYAYRDLMGKRVIYTPQMIVHGMRDVPGYHTNLIDAAITEAGESTSDARIAMHQDGGMLRASIAAGGLKNPSTIWMVSFSREETVSIQRGENAGQDITYHNVVHKMMRLGPWQGEANRDIDIPQPAANEGVAIWVQDDLTGHIMAASFVEG